MRSIVALLLASSLLWGWGRVEKGVVIDGLDVGGMRYECAEEAIRERFEALPLTVHTPTGDVFFPAETFTERDNAALLVRTAAEGETLTSTRRRYWAEMERALAQICAQNAVRAKNARLGFSADGFTYLEGEAGRSCDYAALLADVSRALERGEKEVTLRTYAFPPAETVETLKARTRLLSFRRTLFDPSNAPRAHNIALAASRIAGTLLQPGEEFSFNAAVGPRTEENGFRTAAVISEGNFVPGVGGGVCQASTTLYLAALEAGLTVTEARAHSLAVGYVPPSLDAMVSSASDLKFFNPYDYPVYLLAEAGGGSVGFFVYGMPDGKRYTVESSVLSRIPPPPPEESAEGPFRAAREGIVSESYLVVCGEDGEVLERRRLRLDRYAAVRGTVPPSESPESPEEPEEPAPREEGAHKAEENAPEERKAGRIFRKSCKTG